MPVPPQPPALYLAPEPAAVPRKRGRPRKGTTLDGPVPVPEPKEVVRSAYQRACHKLMSGVRNQHAVALTHSESQALAYGIRRLALIAEECSGSDELNGQSC
jgi:hypothetical protein